MAKMYAWTEIRNGGEIDVVKLPNGGERRVVTKRNSVAMGDEVTKAKLKCSDEEWDALIAGGSVRPYPLPEGTSSSVSPQRAFMQNALNDRGDIDFSMMMDMALIHTPQLPEESDKPEGV